MPSTLRLYHRLPVQCSVSYYGGLSFKLPLAYSLGFWLLITFLVLSRGPVYAEWVALEKQYQSPGQQTVYIESDTIRREGNLVTMVVLVDWKWAQGNGRGAHRFLSTMTHKQFDCVGKRLRLLAYTEFLRHMGTGRRNDGYVDKDTWLPVKPDSINQALWEVTCGKP